MPAASCHWLWLLRGRLCLPAWALVGALRSLGFRGDPRVRRRFPMRRALCLGAFGFGSRRTCCGTWSCVGAPVGRRLLRWRATRGGMTRPLADRFVLLLERLRRSRERNAA